MYSAPQRCVQNVSNLAVGQIFGHHVRHICLKVHFDESAARAHQVAQFGRRRVREAIDVHDASVKHGILNATVELPNKAATSDSTFTMSG